MKVVPLVVLALLVLPVAASTAGPVFFQKEYWWSGFLVPGALDTQSFHVPSTVSMICYARLTVYDGSDHVANFAATLRDGSGRINVVDAGGVVYLKNEGVNRVVPLDPVTPFGNTFRAGTFTFNFQANGFHGDWLFMVYAISSPSECGTLAP